MVIAVTPPGTVQVPLVVKVFVVVAALAVESPTKMPSHVRRVIVVNVFIELCMVLRSSA
jgi:hypothetical protein